MTEVVERYSQPPYNVRYFEIGNEPDVGVGVVRADAQFGCWGDPADPNFGGGYYAEMLKVVYPAVKAANPQAQVMIGGLLMDCDPENPPEGKTCQEVRFLEGVLENGGGEYFDALSYHGYPFYVGGGLWDTQIENWSVRGGVVYGKLAFLEAVMANYGLEKPIFLTETSLLCAEWNERECNPPGEEFYTLQAEYLPRLYLGNWASGIAGTIWYPFDGRGWRYGGMAGPEEAPKPTLEAFQYLTSILGEAGFRGAEQNDEGFVVLAFQGEAGEIWSVWTPDWESRPYPLPEGVTAVTDLFGSPVDISSGEILVDGVHYLFWE
jgi:hypothetical protein